MNKFDFLYRSADCYYGVALRPEFTNYFEGKNINRKTALDLGCGEGRYALYLAKHGCRVTAIDRSGAGIAKLKEMAKRQRIDVNAEIMDIADFVFPENHYQIITAATILDHLPNDLRTRTVRNIQTALAPGGILYANVFTILDPGYRMKKNGATETPLTDISDTAEFMEYYFDQGELKSVFDRLEVLFYYEGVEPDLSHGRPHHHGWACLLARRPATPE